MRKFLIPIAVLLAAIVAGVLYFGQGQAGAPATTTSTRTAVVERRTLERSVTASGTLAAGTEIEASFGASGRVAAVLVRPGDTVTAGQVLARVATTTLALDLSDAQIQLAQSRLKLKQLQVPPTAGDLAIAEANLTSARASLADLLKGPDADTIAIAKLNLERARIQLWQTQLGMQTGPDLPRYQQTINRLRLESAEAGLKQAETSYQETLKGTTTATQITSARAQVTQAENQLARLKSGPSQADIDAAQAQIDTAELDVEAAQAKLDAAVLLAPASGVVASVNARVGETAGPSTAAVVIVDLSHFTVDVSVDELDMMQLRAGQPASVTLDALADMQLSGQVARVALLPVSSNGVNAYAVRMDLPAANESLRAGMSATVYVVLERHANVLAVPNWAIRIDSATGQAIVQVQRGTAVEDMVVTLGYSGDEYSEVLAGLNEGDVVLQAPTTRQQGTGFEAGGPAVIEGPAGGPPGGDMPPGGGPVP